MRVVKAIQMLLAAGAAASIVMAGTAHAQAPGTVVYRCPGNVYTSERELTPKQASERGCRSLEGTPVTVLQTVRPRDSRAASASASRPADSRIDPNDQRARDLERRPILDAELRKEQDRLSELTKQYNNGQPERLGDERNYQKYIDRVAEMKAEIGRKESDIAALKREISKLAP